LDPSQSKRGADTGTVHIVIDGESAGDSAAARTLAPAQTNFTRYTASFEGLDTHDDVNITGGSVSVELAPGDWTITVTAFTAADTAAGRGSATRTVVSGQGVTADIIIAPIIGDGGTGDFRYSVTIPVVDSGFLNLTDMSANTTAPGISINLKDATGNSGGIAEATRNLAAGYYLMNIHLEQSGKYAGKTEVVHIYAGLVTEAVYAFTDADFVAVLGTLADGVWQDGNMIRSGPEYYRFPVTEGTLYAVYWNGYGYNEGDGTKTLYCSVSAYYETGGGSIFGNIDSGYNTPQVFTAESSGNVIIRVEPRYSGYTGTYSVKYGTLPVIDLADGVWQDGDMIVSGYEHYRLPVTEGTSYAVYWNRNSYGDGTKTMSCYVSAYYETDRDSVFYRASSGYTTPRVFTAKSNGNVIIRVEPSSGGTGTYAVMYGEIRPLTADTAESDAITAGGVKLYSFPATANTVYEVSWEDSGDQAGNLYDGNITVTAYQGSIGNNSPFNAVDSGYAAPRKVSYTSDTTIYLKVEGALAGTYSVKYRTFPIPELTEGIWQDGEMVISGNEYHRFSVTEGVSYAVYWNSKDSGDGTKTLPCRVSAYYETDRDSVFYSMSSGYTTPRPFTAKSSGNVIIRVEPSSSSSTGTYAVMYGEIWPLADDTAASGAITAGGVKLYSFPAGANAVYEVSWEDSVDQAGNLYDGNITVTAYQGNIGNNSPFNAVDSGYAAPRKVSYSSDTTIYLKVEGASAGTYSVKYRTFSIPALTDGVWQDGEMIVSGYEYHRFPVTEGASYAVYSNRNSYGDGTKTLSCYVSAYYETDRDSVFYSTSSGYITPRVFTAKSSGNVIIRVEPFPSSSTGTYAVMYGEVKPLAADTAAPGAIITGGVKLYSFPAGANMVYEVSWEDSGDQVGNSYDGDIKVTAYRGSIGSNALFGAVDSGYTTPRKVSYTSDTTIYLKVDGVSDGTYSVKYSAFTIPELTEGVWQDGEMIASGYEYHRFPVTEGVSYAVYWNNGISGDSTKDLYCYVSAYYETGGASAFGNTLNGYTTPQTFTAASDGSVIVRVGPYTIGNTGTYAVLYREIISLNSSMPEMGSITAGGVKLYSFPTVANTKYEISWEDLGDHAGSSSYGGDIRVTAYRGGIGYNNLFNAVDSGYTTLQTVNNASATVIYLKVDGFSDGAYSIKYWQWMPPGTLNITVGLSLDAITITGSDGTNLIRKNGSPSTLTFSAAGYTDVVWYVDGGTPGISGDTLAINALSYAAQLHSVTFTGKKDGSLFSQVIPFTVD
jgi:hypothetical protein